MRLNVIPGLPESRPVKFKWVSGTLFQMIDPKLLREMAGALVQWERFTSYSDAAIAAAEDAVAAVRTYALGVSAPSPAIDLMDTALLELSDAATYTTTAMTMIVNDLASAEAMQVLLTDAKTKVDDARFNNMEFLPDQMPDELGSYPELARLYNLSIDILGYAQEDATAARNSAQHVVDYYDPDHPAYLGQDTGGFTAEETAALFNAFLEGFNAYYAIVGGSFEDALAAYLLTVEGAALWAAYQNALANPAPVISFLCPVIGVEHLDFSNKNFAFVIPADSAKADTAFNLSKIINPNFEEQHPTLYDDIGMYLHVIRNTAGFGGGIGSEIWLPGMAFKYFKDIDNGTMVTVNPFATSAYGTLSEGFAICWISNITTKNALTGDAKVDFAIQLRAIPDGPIDYYDPDVDVLSGQLCHIDRQSRVIVGGADGEMVYAYGFSSSLVRSDNLLRVWRYSKEAEPPEELFSVSLPAGIPSVDPGPPTYNTSGGIMPYSVGDEYFMAYAFTRGATDTLFNTMALVSSTRGEIFSETDTPGSGTSEYYGPGGLVCKVTPENVLLYAMGYFIQDVVGTGLVSIRLRWSGGDVLVEEHSYLRGFFYTHGAKIDVNVNGLPACTTLGTEEDPESYGHYWIVKIGTAPRYRLFLSSDFGSATPGNLERPMVCFWTPDGRYLVASRSSGVTRTFTEAGDLITDAGGGGSLVHGVVVSRLCTQIGGAVVAGDTTTRTYKWIIVSADSTVREGTFTVVEHTSEPTVVTYSAAGHPLRRWGSVYNLAMDDTRMLID